MVCNDRLSRLTAAVDAAYLRAREHVYDYFPPGAPIEAAALSADQIAMLAELQLLETELGDYRHRCYAAAA